MLLQIPPPTDAAYCLQPEALLGTVGTMMGVAFATMIALLALFWMAAQLLKKPEYESFVSIETHQLFVSAILLATVFSATLFACQLSVWFAGADPFTISTGYINHISSHVALKTVVSLEATKAFAQYWGSMTFRWGLTVWGVATPSFPSFILIERVVDFLLLLMTPFVASLMVQQVLLELIKGTAVAFVLPASLVLRVFPPTRSAGSFLMAAAIGFQIVFPFTYVMHWLIVTELMDRAGLSQTLEGMFGTSQLEQGFVPWAILQQGFYDITSMLFRPLDSIGFLLLQALFLPALSITLTIAFIKGLSKFLSQKME